MLDSQFAPPIVIREDQSAEPLTRLPLRGSEDALAHYDEAWLQQVVFQHPTCLPVAEIDQAYLGLVSICCELNTPAGPIDVLYATPQGKLVVLEAKLWRNPEARRKVVGQILDYAKELSHWTYEDLQREVSRATGRKGNALYDLVNERYPEVDEARFVDEVTRSLRMGRFLLLVVGDGIREGIGAIADFLDSYATLQFSFGLVELALYRYGHQELLVQPRVLTRTMVMKRTVVELQDPRLQLKEEEMEDEDDELSDQHRFYRGFWTELLNEISLDDVTQPMANVTRSGCIFFQMPPNPTDAWLTAFFNQGQKQVGVFLTFSRSNLGNELYSKLESAREEIEEEIGIPVVWASDGEKHKIRSSKKFPDLKDPQYKEDIKAFFKDRINRFVNVFRPRLDRYADE